MVVVVVVVVVAVVVELVRRRKGPILAVENISVFKHSHQLTD